MSESPDVAVIGGGPGGYVAALRLAQLGKRVTLVDSGPRLGGVCLNEGCIPSKALVHVAELFHAGKTAERIGISFGEARLDLTKTQVWKEAIIERLGRGINQLMRLHAVEVVRGTASFASEGSIAVDGREIPFGHAIIATGSRPISLPGLPFNGATVLSSTEALSLREVPQTLAVVGGGYLGLELATMFGRFGSAVTVLEMMDQLVPGADAELARSVQRSLEKSGISVHLKARAEGFSDGTLTFSKEGSSESVTADRVLVAVGRRPLTDGLGLERTRVRLDAKGYIAIDAQCRTSQESIFAIGDVTGNPMLAHRASCQGRVAAEAICGVASTMEGKLIPTVAYTSPEIASVGLSEEDAAKRGIPVTVSRYPLLALGKAHAIAKTDGFFKILTGDGGRIVGVHIAAPHASELIGEATLAMECCASVEKLARTVHQHPTLAEGLMEAAWEAITKGGT